MTLRPQAVGLVALGILGAVGLGTYIAVISVGVPELVYLVPKDQRYHRKDCQVVVSAEYHVTKRLEEAAGIYQPCDICDPPRTPRPTSP